MGWVVNGTPVIGPSTGFTPLHVEKLLARTLAIPAARFFRMRRSVSLLVSERSDGSHGIVEGNYQSPILLQWQRAPRESRVLDVTLTELQ